MQQTFPLKRGDTLALMQGAGTTLDVTGGNAWMTQFGDTNDHVVRDDKRQVKSNGSVLLYAFQDCRVALNGPDSAQVQLRRRGEVPVPIVEAAAGRAMPALWRWFAFA